MSKAKLAKLADQTLQQVLEDARIQACDFLVVSDGSGTTWELPCGWAATLVDTRTFERRVFHGGASHGSNIFAELFGITHPLLWLLSQQRPVKVGGTHVHILTDCETLATTWNHKTTRKKNRELWGLLDAIQRRGLMLHFHWRNRSTTALNILADRLASANRLSQLPLAGQVILGLGAESPHDFNPDE